MNKVKQEAMINKHIDHTSSKRAEKLQWEYKFSLGKNEIVMRHHKN